MERITTNFNFSSTAAEVIQGVDLSGKRAIVTGGASGIGLETAKALSAAGAAVTLAVRRPAAARAVAEDIGVSTGNDAVEVRSLDVSDPASVRRFCADWIGPLQILINNAGIMALQDLHRTPEGWEMQMGIHLVFFLHVTTGPDNTNNVMALAFGVLIVALVVVGSLLIMADLNDNMMPAAELKNLQMQH